MAVLSFDIEISDVFDLRPGEDINKYAPFHLAVASTAIVGGEERLWYSADEDGTPLTSMTRQRAGELLAYLQERQAQGDMVCAWNGLSFDLRWIGHVAGDLALAARVALKSYDPMFQFFNQRGFPIGLAAVGEAMGIEQRKSMTGADAPRLWQAGQHQAVMDYVLGDSRLTNEIVLAIMKRREIRWTTKKGVVRNERIDQLETVETVLHKPEPDQSWMDTPMPRRRFHAWFPDGV